MITSSLLLPIEFQHHGISSSTPPPALVVSCYLLPWSHCFASVTLCAANSRRFCCTPLSPPHGGPLSQASSLINGSVAVVGYRQSSGPGGPAPWYCTLYWHPHSVRSARPKDVTSLQSPSFALLGSVTCVPCFVPVAWLQPLSPLPSGLGHGPHPPLACSLVSSLGPSHHTFLS